ncbi:MAG: RHS repeat-associated core domain-containing protein, partial [Bacteroidales bacterium]|nr:RHS repeat-associated core domain-containing protein [Bacteroidales bacterium]
RNTYRPDGVCRIGLISRFYSMARLSALTASKRICCANSLRISKKTSKMVYDSKGRLNTNETYLGNLVLNFGIPSQILHPEGVVDVSNLSQPVVHYHLKDHLGNVRVVVNPSATNTALISQTNDYYPFGMCYTKNPGSFTNKRKYNGKEEQEMPGCWLDYGARFYDPQLGRWHTIDPLCEDGGQESVTPYGYVFNDPIKHNDPDGRFPLLSNLVGAFAGALVEYGGQVAANVYSTKSISLSSFTDNIDVGDIGLAASEGFLTSGGSVIKNALVKGAVVVGSEVARNYLDVTTSSDGTGLKVSTNDVGTTVKNTAIGLTAGKIGDVAPAPKVNVINAPTPKQAVSKARVDAKANGTTVNRQQRIATESKAKQVQKTAATVNKTTAKTPQSTVASGTSETIKRETDEKR